MTFPNEPSGIISTATVWYQGARTLPRTGLLSRIEEKHPLLRNWTCTEEALVRWHDACTTAFVLCAMRSSSELLESKESGIARLTLTDLYRSDFPDGFLLVDAALSTEEWMTVLRRDLSYGAWVLCALAETLMLNPDNDEEADLAATLGAVVINFGDQWWIK